MARFGTGINASLGAINYAPYMQGAMAGSQAIAQGIASLGQAAGGAIRDYKQKKEEEKKIGETIGFLETNFKKDPGTYTMFDDGAGKFDRSAAEAAVRSVGPSGIMTFINFSQASQANRDVKAEKDAEKARRKAVDGLLGMSDPVAQQSALAAATDDVRSAFQQENLKRQTMQAQLEGQRSQTNLIDTQTQGLRQKMNQPEQPSVEEQRFAFDQQKYATEQAQKTEEKQQKEEGVRKAQEAFQVTVDQTLKNIEEAKGLSKLNAGGPISTLPGVARVGSIFFKSADQTRKLVNLSESIRSSLAMDAIRALKAASPTGSTGLGSVSNIELQTLERSIANLDPSLDEKDYYKILEDIENVVRKMNAKPDADASPLSENELNALQKTKRNRRN